MYFSLLENAVLPEFLDAYVSIGRGLQPIGMDVVKGGEFIPMVVHGVRILAFVMDNSVLLACRLGHVDFYFRFSNFYEYT